MGSTGKARLCHSIWTQGEEGLDLVFLLPWIKQGDVDVEEGQGRHAASVQVSIGYTHKLTQSSEELRVQQFGLFWFGYKHTKISIVGLDNVGQASLFSTVLKWDLQKPQLFLPEDSDTSSWSSDTSQERNVSMLGRSIETLPVEVSFNSR